MKRYIKIKIDFYLIFNFILVDIFIFIKMDQLDTKPISFNIINVAGDSIMTYELKEYDTLGEFKYNIRKNLENNTQNGFNSNINLLQDDTIIDCDLDDYVIDNINDSILYLSIIFVPITEKNNLEFIINLLNFTIETENKLVFLNVIKSNIDNNKLIKSLVEYLIKLSIGYTIHPHELSDLNFYYSIIKELPEYYNDYDKTLMRSQEFTNYVIEIINPIFEFIFSQCKHKQFRKLEFNSNVLLKKCCEFLGKMYNYNIFYDFNFIKIIYKLILLSSDINQFTQKECILQFSSKESFLHKDKESYKENDYNNFLKYCNELDKDMFIFIFT